MSPAEAFESFEVADLKQVYRTLHAHLTEHIELMDSEFLEGLQTHLQKQARGDGVDLADHAQWDRWLGNAATPCEERMANRRPLV